jgi:hypothetical protein
MKRIEKRSGAAAGLGQFNCTPACTVGAKKLLIPTAPIATAVTIAKALTSLLN